MPLEQWRKHGYILRAASANANGTVNSGILKDKTYFYWDHKLEQYICKK